MKLILIYNANSGFVNTIGDSLHKLFFPKTYKCNLCKLTFGLMSVYPEWNTFLKKLKIPISFLHKNEYNGKNKLPIILLEQNGNEFVLLSAQEINACKTLKALQQKVTDKLSKV